jgi:DNA polymerase V
MVKLKQSGGQRAGAGRPSGSGKFREKTRPVRIPESLMPQVSEFLECHVGGAQAPTNSAVVHLNNPNNSNNPTFFHAMTPIPQSFPLYSSRVSAGFPSPTDDHIETKLDLNRYLVKRPAATFFVRVEGDSMIGAGIHENDLLVVDRSIKPTNGKIIIAVINGELTVKRLRLQKGNITLMPENERYSALTVDETMDFTIWGVVTNVIHAV